MKIDREQPICGIAPATLKKIFAVESFDTLRLMRIAGLGEPAASNALSCLASEGWVHFEENDDGVDWWTTTELAARLKATRLIRRFPVSEGRRIVEDVVREAQLLNREPMRSWRITGIYLFGSVLTGAEDDLAGDVDLVIETRERRLPKERLLEIRRQELPSSRRMDHMQRTFWPSSALLRGIKKVSNKIALHVKLDLEVFGMPFRQVYAFDIATEAEVPFNPTTRREEPRKHPLPEKSAPAPATKRLRPWPRLKGNRPICLATDSGRLAEHLWLNGWKIDTIAERLHTKAGDVVGYLATRSDGAAFQPVFDAALDRTVGPYLRPARGLFTVVNVSTPNGWQKVEVRYVSKKTYETVASLRFVDGDRGMFHSAPPALIPDMERIAKAALVWLAKTKPRTTGLGLSASLLYEKGREPKDPAGRRPIDFRPLVRPMQKVLDAVWEHPRGKYEGYERELEVSFSTADRVEIYYWKGAPWRPGSTRKRVRKAVATPIRAVMDPLLENWSSILDGGTHYTMSVRGSDLEDYR